MKQQQKLSFGIFVIILIAQHTCAANLRRSAETESDAVTASPVANVRAKFEIEALTETKNFLNGMFRSQIAYFGKVKENLPANTKRVLDINSYILRLEQAIEAENIDQKDKMWRDTFSEFSESAFLLNIKSDTGVSNNEYKKILEDNGLEEVTKNFLFDVAAYFWKMAKASGKVVEATIAEHLEKLKRDRNEV